VQCIWEIPDYVYGHVNVEPVLLRRSDVKRLKSICILTVLLLTTTVSADLIVQQHVVGEKVVLDTKTNLYWYWDLKEFEWSTYSQQIAAIANLGNYGGVGIADWHIATEDEIAGLFENQLSVFAGYDSTGLEIIEVSFKPSFQESDMIGGLGGFLEYRDTTFQGRYNSGVEGAPLSHHYAEWVHYWIGGTGELQGRSLRIFP